MNASETMGAVLRQLREARGLSLAEAARRSGLGRSTLFQWEADLRSPRGMPLERLMDALEAPDRLRSRLIAQADPRHARIVLAHRAIGSPVEVGQIVRAMRLRRRMTQTEAAQAAGVTQGTFARWEGGGDVPDAPTLHALGFALGASAEETAALTLARSGRGDVPDTPEKAVYASIALRWWEDSLHEVLQLGLEAAAWWRSTHDPAWDVAATSAMAKRAFRYFLDGRLDEAETTARRTVRLAQRPEARSEAVMALDVIEVVSRRRGDPPAATIRLAEAWAESIPEHDSPEGDSKVWATKIAARARAATGDLDGALRLAQPIPEWLALRASGKELDRRVSFEFASVFITGNAPSRALPYLDPEPQSVATKTLNAGILLANGEEVPSAWLEEFRGVRPTSNVELRKAMRRVEWAVSQDWPTGERAARLPYFY